MKKVAVVILNWNGLDLMKEFLPSICAHTPTDIADVVVADNGSTDGSVEWLKRNHPDVILHPEVFLAFLTHRIILTGSHSPSWRCPLTRPASSSSLHPEAFP